MLPFPSLMLAKAAAAGGGSAVAPTFGAVGTHTAGSTSATYPAGISAGDYLELVVAANGAGADTAYSSTGWTAGPSYRHQATGGPSGGAAFGIYVLWKVATGSESGTVTVGRTGTAPTREGAVIERFSGVDTSGTPYEGVTTAFNDSTAGSLTYGAITTTANGRLLIDRYGSSISAIGVTAGSGWTREYQLDRTGIGPDYIFTMTRKDAVGYGAQSAEVATPASNTAGVMLSYALKGV